MSDSMFLTPEELVDLTDRRQSASQVRILRALGIDHKVRADRRVMVLREHVKQQFGAREAKQSTQVEAFNWSAA